MSDTQFYPLRIKAVRPETATAVCVSFDVPDELAQDATEDALLLPAPSLWGRYWHPA